MLAHPASDQALHHLPHILAQPASQGEVPPSASLVLLILPQGPPPTLSQFLSHVAGGGEDPHWTPYTSSCAPCLLSYDWILHLESPSLPLEEAALLSSSGLGALLPGGLRPRHREGPGAGGLREGYSKVPCPLLKHLVAMYLEDFLLFGYSVQEYLKEAGSNCTLPEPGVSDSNKIYSDMIHYYIALGREFSYSYQSSPTEGLI